MSNIEEFEITKGQRFAGNITAGAGVILCGLFLLLCGTNVIGLKVSDILLASLLLTVGLVLLVTGLIHKNTVSMWLAFAFLTPGVIELLVKYTSLGYSNLYPFYIAIPAISSIFTMLYSRMWKAHFNIIILFAVLAIIFSLKSFNLLGWSVVLPIMIVTIGLAIVLLAVKFKMSDEDKE